MIYDIEYYHDTFETLMDFVYEVLDHVQLEEDKSKSDELISLLSDIIIDFGDMSREDLEDEIGERE